MLEIKNLKKYYSIRESGTLANIFSTPKRQMKAVNDVSFSVNSGETVGLVGESGCGKTTLGRTVVKLLEPTGGEVLFNGKNVFQLNDEELKGFRKKVQIIFQDPYSSLNPRMKISSIVTEGLIIHSEIRKKNIKDKAKELMDIVGLSGELIDRYPHEFSGGQRQRIGIARAVSLHPEYIICDEPVSSLDVSVQAQIINLLIDLQEKFNLGYIFISHDLSVVRYLSHKIAVMYLGKIVEFAETGELFSNPLHPYTKLLFSSLPEEHGALQTFYKDGRHPDDLPSVHGHSPWYSGIRGKKNKTEISEMADAEAGGCLFYSRCPEAKPECRETIPELKTVKGEHKVSCIQIK